MQINRLTSSVCENRKLTANTKISIYRACVIIVLYGSETWSLYCRQERRLSDFHFRCLGINWSERITNAVVFLRAQFTQPLRSSPTASAPHYMPDKTRGQWMWMSRDQRSLLSWRRELHRELGRGEEKTEASVLDWKKTTQRHRKRMSSRASVSIETLTLVWAYTVIIDTAPSSSVHNSLGEDQCSIETEGCHTEKYECVYIRAVGVCCILVLRVFLYIYILVHTYSYTLTQSYTYIRVIFTFSYTPMHTYIYTHINAYAYIGVVFLCIVVQTYLF